MPETFRVGLYTAQDLTQRQTIAKLWQLLDNPIIGPNRFDAVEKARRSFDPHEYETARGLHANEGMLFVRGAKAGFKAIFPHQVDGLTRWALWWNLSEMVGSGREKWLEWLFELCQQLPPHYGYGCSTEEYEAKHLEVVSGGRGYATHYLGVSQAEFKQYLPGIYWLTIFGLQLVNHFGDLSSLRGVDSSTLRNRQVALIIDGPVLPDDMGRRLAAEAELADSLGRQYFFDRTRKAEKRRQVPELLKELRSQSAPS
jgi:hypothetical protein